METEAAERAAEELTPESLALLLRLARQEKDVRLAVCAKRVLLKILGLTEQDLDVSEEALGC